MYAGPLPWRNIYGAIGGVLGMAAGLIPLFGEEPGAGLLLGGIGGALLGGHFGQYLDDQRAKRLRRPGE